MTTETDPQIELVIETGDDSRLLIRTWTAPNGQKLVTVAPQYTGRDGTWKLRHSGLALQPEHAQELAPLLLEMADHVVGDGR